MKTMLPWVIVFFEGGDEEDERIYGEYATLEEAQEVLPIAMWREGTAFILTPERA